MSKRLLLASLVIVVLAGLLGPSQWLTEFGSSARAQTSTEDPDVAPMPGDDAAARLQAAIADRQYEADRIDNAENSYQSARDLTPAIPNFYLVSLNEPIPMAIFLKATEPYDSLQPTRVYSWIHTGDLPHPVTGVHDFANDIWDGTGTVEEATADFNGRASSYLVRQNQGTAEALTASMTTAAGVPVESVGALRDAIAETNQFLDFVDANGASFYGFQCFCSPEEIDRFEEEVVRAGFTADNETTPDPGIFKAVEATVPEEESMPIWPIDPLRDLIIATDGAYGI